ncbi:hypothetical protein QBC37DRAFT_447197 [Rhypophila decipiens]|uniref:Uncharacterized protein n=1 Tax=Rhypophila decipiens TaxID=261697 RepID=A0AAN6Y1P8_9PEZI|nr:hypothetical protein QBC37DRAFT_447197 [Rhypophila decipiens]
MMFVTRITLLVAIQGVAGTLVARQSRVDGGVPVKIDVLQPKNFKELGAKRVKITYGPLAIPSAGDKDTGGMITYSDPNLVVPCTGCFITGMDTDLQWEDGTTANANKGIWLHHTGLMNLNRTDAGCPEWPERIGVNGNERSSFDFTTKGTRKAGYYLQKGDQILKAIDVMNMSDLPRSVYLVMEWEYIEGTPSGFDVVWPVWLDARGNCFETPLSKTGVTEAPVFNSTMLEPGYTVPFDSDLLLLVPHIHDGNVAQDIFMDGKLICTSVPAYGETEAFVTHEGMYGHEHEHEEEEPAHEHGPHRTRKRQDHDHESSGHTYHVSSITQCANIGKVAKGSKFLLTSYYNMTEHKPMTGHDGKEEEIMAIEFLHFARPFDEAMKDIQSQGKPNLQSFVDTVRGLDG